MSRSHFFLFVLLAAFLVAACPASATVAAPPPDLNSGWRFHLGDAPGAGAKDFADTAWETVSLPHPARLEALVTSPGAKQQWEGLCWYRKIITLPATAAGQAVLLRFEGAMNLAQVFVNGQLRASSLDGYTPFVVDLSDFAGAPAPITVAVRLDNRPSALTGPKPLAQLDFHLFHGLYRTVSLIIKPPLHITDEILENKVASGGVFVTYPQVSAAAATIAVQVHVRNRAPGAAGFTIATILRDLAGNEVARTETGGLALAGGEARAFATHFDVASPRLWSPQAPNLYFLDVALRANGKTVDSHRERIGIRRFELGAGGLSINGAKFFLRGVNRHQEYPYVGNAVPARAQYRDALKIKQAGFDYVRLSHYPQSPDFLEACDELGLVVMDCLLGWQFNPGTLAFQDNRVAAARALVRRDRNHPCVAFWELCLNETKMAPEFIARLHAVGHEEYPGDQMFTAGWLKGYDVKLTARQAGSTAEFAAANFPCVVSEYGDWEYHAGDAGLNQDEWKNLKGAERSSRQLRGDGEVRLLQQATNLEEAHTENRGTPALADGYWVMYDYNRGYAADLEASGVMDIFRLPKFAEAFFRSQRNAEENVASGLIGGPMVFVSTWWTPQSPTNVRVFSNCEEVELFLNSRSLGRQKPAQNRATANLPHPPFIFKVGRFEPGELRAVGYRHDAVVTQHRVRTPGTPTHLALSVDLSGRPLAPGGDLVFVHAQIADANGTVVPNATTTVSFTVAGDAQLIGDNPIAAEAGIATVLLKTGTKPGTLTLKATAGPLQGKLTVK